MERGLPPDGYRWINGGPAIELVDPESCPAGHPFDLDQRGYAPCVEHGGHSKWSCRCGAMLYRIPGEFVDRLTCR